MNFYSPDTLILVHYFLPKLDGFSNKEQHSVFKCRKITCSEVTVQFGSVTQSSIEIQLRKSDLQVFQLLGLLSEGFCSQI